MTARQIMDTVEKRYRIMERIMCLEDMEMVEEIIRSGRKHSPEISYAGVDTETGILLLALVDVMKRLKKLEKENRK